MNAAKIRLSAEEMVLLKNADWILTKNSILEKVKAMLGELAVMQKEIIHENTEGIFPEEVLASSAKISGGENYRGLPWVVLDHPRYFEKANTMALRTLFWWGRCFSVTLHLSGRYKSQFERTILDKHDAMLAINPAAEDELKNKTLYVCVNGQEWEHHFEETNYKPIQQLSSGEWQQTILEKPFIKLAKMIPLEQWNGQYDMNDILALHYSTLLDMLVQNV